MAYGFNQETKSEKSNLPYFEAGIHENVSIENIAFEESKEGSGNYVLAFHFKGANGEVFRHTEWEVKDEDPKIVDKIENLGKRVKHILTKFMPEEECILEGNSWSVFCKGVLKLVLGKYNTIKVAIKLVYGNNGYLQFTRYTGFIALDKKDLKIGKNEIMIRPNTKPTTADELDQASSPSKSLDSNDVLPF